MNECLIDLKKIYIEKVKLIFIQMTFKVGIFPRFLYVLLTIKTSIGVRFQEDTGCRSKSILNPMRGEGTCTAHPTPQPLPFFLLAVVVIGNRFYKIGT